MTRARSALIVMRAAAAVCAVAIAGALAGCERENRRFAESPPTATAEGVVQTSDLQPGAATVHTTIESPYEHNAWEVAQGQQLFNNMNCAGCHFHGGGGIGPPLMDDLWIYGSDPQNIFDTIVKGRPNGMPSYAGKLSNTQVWQLVAYVRSLSALIPKGARGGRSDEMTVTTPPAQSHPEKPRNSSQPPSTIVP